MIQILAAAALKATVMLLLVFGVAALLRRASAAARHTVWSSGFAGLLVLPFLATTLPWRLEVLPAAATVVEPRSRVAAPIYEPTIHEPEQVVREPATTTTDAPSESAAEAQETTPLTPSFWFVALWTLGAGLVVGRVVLGAFVMGWLGRRGETLTDPSWAATLDEAARQLGVKTRVRLIRSDHIPMPMTSGLLRPVIVLPADSDQWDRERRLAVLLHELAHVRRGDLWVHFLAQAVCACYWFHPLAWTAARRLRAESERACDDLVLSAGTKASEYAGHLLQLVRRSGRGRAPAVALPMAQRSDFEGRLLAILEPGVSRRPLGRLTALATVLGISLLVLPLAAMSPTRREAPVVAAQNPSTPPTPTPEPPPSRRRARDMTSVHVEAGIQAAAEIARAAAEQAVDAEAIGAMAERAARQVSTALAQAAGHLRKQGSSNPAVLRGLIEALGDSDVEVRQHAATALGNSEDTAAVSALIEALRRDADATVRKTCAWALGEIEDARAVAALVEALKSDRDDEVRKTSAWALGEIESPAAIAGLGAALNDSNSEVRKNAVWALGEIEDARAVPALLPFLKDADLETRKTAVWALGEIENSAAVEPLATMLRDDAAEVRSMAAWALGQIEDSRASAALATALKDANAEVRSKAAWALGQIEGDQAPPALIEALKDENREVRKMALWALGQIDDTSALDAIVTLLKDPDPEIRRAAAQALGKNH